MVQAALLLLAVLLATPPLAPGAPTPPGEPYVNAAFGVRLELPDDWTVSDEQREGDGLRLVLRPDAEPGAAELTLRVNPPGVPADARATQELVWATLADDAYRDAARTTRALAGRDDLPGLVVDTDSQGVAVRVRQAYLVEHGWLVLVQDVVPVSQAERRTADADRLWAGLSFVPLSDAAAAERRLAELAARCGSEVDWAPDWETAAARAAAAGLPVLVSFRRYPGFDTVDTAMTGAFMDRDVIALVNRRAVPLRATSPEGLPFAAPERFGLGPATFGTAILLVDPRSGDVLWDGAAAADGLLCQAFAALPADLSGAPVAGDAAPRERARAHALRGELQPALELLGEPDDAAGRALLARLHLRRHEPEAALAALDGATPGDDATRGDPDSVAARPGDGAPATADTSTADTSTDDARDGAAPSADGATVGSGAGAELALLRSTALTTLGRFGDAAAVIDALLAAPLEPDDRAQALLHRALLTLALEDHAAAEPWLRRVTDEHADTRWAWSAAALLTSDVWALERRWRMDGRDDRLALELVRPPRFAPLPVARAAEAADDARDWLLAHQHADGHWLLPGSLERPADEPPSDFELAVAAHALLALLPRADDPAVSDAVERAAAWLVEATARSLAGPDDATYMDYSVWSRPAVLEAYAALVRSGRGDARVLRRQAEGLVAELAARAKPEGGWSYYLTGDLGSAPPQVLSAMSFTCAAAVLGLEAARDAGLVKSRKVAPLLTGGLDALERGRRDDGSFEYMVAPAAGPREAARGAGDVGRGPVCVAALIAGGRADRDELVTALEAFLPERESYVRERGKHLMHAGTGAQGSHYLLFDLLHAARAVAALSPAQRAPFVGPLSEALLACRVDDGAFVDLPIMGRAWGAAAALAALDLLAVSE